MTYLSKVFAISVFSILITVQSQAAWADGGGTHVWDTGGSSTLEGTTYSLELHGKHRLENKYVDKAPSESTWIWRVYPMCNNEHEANLANINCNLATAQNCQLADGTQGHLYKVEAGPDDKHLAVLNDQECLGPRDVLDLTNAAADARAVFAEAVAKLPKPHISHDPAGYSLANLDAIMQAGCDDSKPVPPTTVALDGTSITLHIDRVFTWTWGDGSDPTVTTSCGHHYDGHTLPASAPGTYVTHRWKEPATDGYLVTLTVTYTPRYDVRDIDTGVPLTLDLTSEPATVTTTATIPVYEAMAQLVS